MGVSTLAFRFLDGQGSPLIKRGSAFFTNRDDLFWTHLRRTT
jgi:hypothetical protein